MPLLPRQYVPPGFELALRHGEALCTSSWWNVWLSDDPAAWDGAVLRLNARQSALGALCDDLRLVRAHLAEFCPRHPRFPHSADLILAEIGAERPLYHVLLGCEGRGLLQSVGWHSDETIADGREDIRQMYAEALGRWLACEAGDSVGDVRVSGFLGAHSAGRAQVARELLALLGNSLPALATLAGVTRAICGRVIDLERLPKPAPFPFGCFGCAAVTNASGYEATGCNIGMLLDAALLCAGAEAGDVTTLSERHRRFRQEQVLAYAAAVNAWLTAEPALLFAWPSGTIFVDQERSLAVMRRVNELLGAHSPAKDWLAGCLLRTLVGNRSRPGRAELLDRYPQATGWLEI